jgi:hypothetical protein
MLQPKRDVRLTAFPPSHVSLPCVAEVIKNNADRYFASEDSIRKRSIQEEIVRIINERGRFLEFDKAQDGWKQICNNLARVKVAQALQYRVRQKRKEVYEATVTREEENWPAVPAASLQRAAVSLPTLLAQQRHLGRALSVPTQPTYPPPPPPLPPLLLARSSSFPTQPHQQQIPSRREDELLSDDEIFAALRHLPPWNDDGHRSP